MINVTTGEIACFGGALPFYSFTVGNGITYTRGTPIHLEMMYRAHDLTAAHPATIQYRAIYNGNTYDSPELPFGKQNPAECDPNGLHGMLNDGRAGGYFQPRANTGASLTATWTNIRFECLLGDGTPLANGATIETRTFNDCPLSTVTTTNNYPASVQITDAMDPECVGFANLHSFSFSEDGGATAAVFDNDANFRFGADVMISGAGEGEGGLRLSPWYGKFVDGRFMINVTTGEIACFGGALPFYSFTVGNGITYTRGTSIHLEMTYRANNLTAAHPATIQYRAIYNGNTYDSPVLPFGKQNGAECDDNGLYGMLNDGRAGGYFQARANTGASLTATWSDIEYAVLPDCPCNAPTLTLTPDELWPPNHKMVDIHATVSTDPGCDAGVDVTLLSITSNEPDNGKGDGNTVNDIQGANYGTADFDFQLRSERQGGGDGRVYTVCYRVVDAGGDASTLCGTVTVAHDQSGNAALSLDAQGRWLIIYGRASMPVSAIAGGSVELGNDNFQRVRLAGNRSFGDFDRDGVTDMRVGISSEEAARVGALTPGSTLFAHWTLGGTRYMASLTGVAGATPQPLQLAVSVRPNPAQGTATIHCTLPREMTVELSVYDVAGRMVGQLVHGVLPAGEHTLSWRPSAGASAGLYLYRLRTPDGTLQGRFVVFE
jgi:hypothetical protein